MRLERVIKDQVSNHHVTVFPAPTLISEMEPSKTINLKNSKYLVLRTVSERLHYRILDKESNENEFWDIWWMENFAHCTRPKMKAMKKGQRVNHFAAITEICIKNQLARNLNRSKYVFSNEYPTIT